MIGRLTGLGVAASMVATVGPISLDLGTLEAGATGMLSLVRPLIEAALAGTLLLQVFTLWLPLLPASC